MPIPGLMALPFGQVLAGIALVLTRTRSVFDTHQFDICANDKALRAGIDWYIALVLYSFVLSQSFIHSGSFAICAALNKV